MVHLLSLCVLTFCQTSNLEEADRLKAQGKLFRAEGFYLAEEPQNEEIYRVALSLSELSLRIGNTETRRQFYQSYLTKSRTWRGVAAIVLASLAADREAYDEFAAHAEIIFSEYPQPHPLRWRLLYHAARYTDLDPATLTLDENELSWFLALRRLDPQAALPTGEVLEKLPLSLRQLCLLQQAQSTPIATSDTDEELLYTSLLLALNEALVKQDLAATAVLINQLTPIDEKLGRSDLSLFFYPLIAEFFKLRQESARAERVLQNLGLARSYAVLPFLSHPNLARHLPAAPKEAAHPVVHAVPEPSASSAPTDGAEMKAEVQPASEASAATNPTEEMVTPPATPRTSEATPPVADPVAEPHSETLALTSYEAIERRLQWGSRNLELKVRGLEPVTQYRKIYRNYLFGLHFLNTGRTSEARDRLSVAAAQISELPFPGLESKIMLALATVNERETHLEKAAWYRLQALQLWSAPQNLPLLDHDENGPMPAYVLIDRVLAERDNADSIHPLLHYSETAAFVRTRQRAYHREALCANAMLAGQITQIGKQLGQQVESLADNPSHEPNPRRFNETLDLWSRLWSQSIAYYRQVGTPSVQELQRALGTRDRIVSFIEGERKLGVLLISKTQAFGLALGDRSAFLALNEDERMGFLVARLGTLWEGEGALYFSLSPSWRATNLLANLRRKMADSSKLRLIFSLRSLLAEKSRGDCNGVLYCGEGRLPINFSNAESLDTLPLIDLERSRFEEQLERHGSLIYSGPLQLTDEGLALGDPLVRLYFHEIVHYNERLCSLTLIAQKSLNWSTLLDELELVNPSSATTINLVETMSAIENLPKEAGGNGIRIY